MALNTSIMTNTDLRVQLHQYIDRVNEGFLQAVHGIVSAYLQKDQFIGYETDGSTVMAKEFIAQAEQAVQEMKNGAAGISVKELEQKPNQWLNRTR